MGLHDEGYTTALHAAIVSYFCGLSPAVFVPSNVILAKLAACQSQTLVGGWRFSLRFCSQRAILRTGRHSRPPLVIKLPATKNGTTNDPVESRIAPAQDEYSLSNCRRRRPPGCKGCARARPEAPNLEAYTIWERALSIIGGDTHTSVVAVPLRMLGQQPTKMLLQLRRCLFKLH